MSHTTRPDTDALAYSLPADAFYNLLRELQRTLPPPPDSPHDRKCRNHAIVAQISALRPNDSAEAIFAAQIVAATEQWTDCLYWAQRFIAAEDFTRAAQCRAQAASMMRQADRAQRALERIQTVRRKLYADPETTDAAERTEHITMVMLAEALAQLPEPQKPEPAPAGTRVSAKPKALKQSQPDELTTEQNPPVSKTTDQSRKHKTETAARQPERPRESAARLAMIDKFLFAPRGPGWDRPMFFPDKSAAKPAEPGESNSNGTGK